MILSSLKLENFRNYGSSELNLESNKGLVYLIGDNAQGKTNLLEAIYALFLGKSFLKVQNQDLIQWGQDFARVKGKLEKSGEQVNLELFLGLSPNPRRATKINDVKIALNDYVGIGRVVLFHPMDLNMMYLGPSARRDFLDDINSQTQKGYLASLRQYNKVIKQKNALLKRIKNGEAKRNDLEVWNELIAVEGSKITKIRAQLLNGINQKIEDLYNSIAKEKQKISFNYHSNLGLDLEEIMENKNLTDFFRMRLEERKETEIIVEYSLIGPQRDDFSIEIKGVNVNLHASRGEIRTMMLALKFLEMDLQKAGSDETPLLLLDDVLSELDHQRQLMLLQRVKDFQTIITTTKDSATINQEKLIPGDFWEVHNGRVFHI